MDYLRKFLMLMLLHYSNSLVDHLWLVLGSRALMG